MMNDAERLKAMYALLNEAVIDRGVGTGWLDVAAAACRDYRMSRPDTRTGLGATPTVERKDDGDAA